MLERSLARLGRGVLAVTVSLCCASCSSERAPEQTPWLVFGIDGAEWRVIESMWEEGGLPHLKALAQRGVRARLKTAYAKSPVIWTSIATGVKAERHGIVDFVIPTEDGDVPLSSKQRQVPAIWNLMTLLDRPVAVFGWWATWPAESVNGMIVSDRFGSGLEHEVFPDDAVRPIAPTLAYGLGLPVARDADGKVREELFNDEFRRQTPRREVSSWGSVDTTEVTRSDADEEILEELRALEYLD